MNQLLSYQTEGAENETIVVQEGADGKTIVLQEGAEAETIVVQESTESESTYHVVILSNIFKTFG